MWIQFGGLLKFLCGFVVVTLLIQRQSKLIVGGRIIRF